MTRPIPILVHAWAEGGKAWAQSGSGQAGPLARYT
jgi:hypothetical protein